MIKQEIFLDLLYFIKSTLNGAKAVIGISGGKDSTVCAALCAKAIGKENVIGVLMPQGKQSDIEDSYRVCKHLGINHIEVNIQDIYNSFLVAVPGASTESAVKYNIPPRIRMTVLYAIAQANHGRVICTSNASEAYIGWTTKWGDNVGDIAPILKFTKSEVEELGEILELPDDLVHKAPADGLTGSSDEDNFGFTYEELDNFIRSSGDCISNTVREAIILKYHQSKHKRDQIPRFEY